MAKVERPLFSDEATGRLGLSVSFRRADVWPQVTGHFNRSPTRRAGALAQRGKFKAACIAWNGLSVEQKQTYKEAAPDGWTGFNYYLSQVL